MELLKLLLATGKEEWDEKQITQMIRDKLEKIGAPQITESQIAQFVGEMRELAQCKVRSEAEKKGELEKMYSTLTHLYKAFKMESAAVSSITLAV
jgi:hypothetical protein